MSLYRGRESGAGGCAASGGLCGSLRSITFEPMDDLRGQVTDCLLQGLQIAMDVACHSLIRKARLDDPSMDEGGCLVTMT